MGGVVTAPSIISLGGGVQSSAMVVLAGLGELGVHVDAAVFADVGADSENPGTMAFLADHLTPWAADHGIEIVTVRRTRRDGTPYPTLLESALDPANRTIPIPMRMANGAPGNRTCTAEWKIRVVRKWLRQHGATKHDPAAVAIGFSTDEIERVGRRRVDPVEQPVYPLLDLNMNRQDCQAVFARVGLPMPPKSACFYCPFRSRRAWREMRRDNPETFARAVAIEGALNTKRARLGKDDVYFTADGKHLADLPSAEAPLFDPDGLDGSEGCDDGGCWT